MQEAKRIQTVPPVDDDRDGLTTLTAMQRTALETQMEMARKYPRDPVAAIKTSTMIATQSEEVAQACMYKMPRGGKEIEGPSVRLAEIISSQWGHIMTQSAVLVIGKKEITAQGRCVDLQSGNAVEVEVRRRITDKGGKRYNDDMITVTGNAACAIAFRNAVFKVIPSALVQSVYNAVKEKAVGPAAELAKRRTKIVNRIKEAYHVSEERILAAVGVKKLDEIGADELETLIGYGTAIANGDIKAHEVFPAPGKKAKDKLNETLNAAQEKEAADETPEASESAPEATTPAPGSPPQGPAPEDEGGKQDSPPAPPKSTKGKKKDAKQPGPWDMVVMAFAERAEIKGDEAEKRLASYAQKKFRKPSNQLDADQLSSLRSDIKVVVDLNLIR